MKTLTPNCVVRLATISDIDSIVEISEEMALSAKQRKTGIAVRTPEFLMDKVKDGLAMIAIHSQTQEWIGFCYLELWKNEKYVANSGLIISAKYRGQGFSRNIKTAIFSLCKKSFLPLFYLV